MNIKANSAWCVLWLGLLGKIRAVKITDQFLALLVALVWGTNFVLIEIGLRDFPPFLFAALRFLFVALPLVFLLPRPQVSWIAMGAYGVLIGFGQFGLLFWAIRDNITPGLASLVVQIQVFFTILLATFFLKEVIRNIQWVALTISFCGIVVIATYTDGATTALGLLVVSLAALSWAGGNLIVKTAKPGDIIAFIAWSSLFAVPPLLAMSFMLDGEAAIAASLRSAGWEGWAVVLWQSIGNTLLGYGLWNLLLNRYVASIVTPWALLVPVFGMAASAVLLGESMPLWKQFAAVLIISGLVLNLLAGHLEKRRSV